MNNRAVQQLTAQLATSALVDDAGTALGGVRKVSEAVKRAQAMVIAEPQVWQRGKDRASFVLGRIREGLAVPARNQFPTDVTKLVARAPLNRIGDPSPRSPPRS